MNNKEQEVLNAIETKRTEMNNLIAISTGQALNSNVIVKISQELDALLNQYQKLVDKKNNIKNDDKNV